MAKAGITLTVDPFLTQTRINLCLFDCVNRQPESFSCNIKTINIDKNGRCDSFESTPYRGQENDE